MVQETVDAAYLQSVFEECLGILAQNIKPEGIRAIQENWNSGSQNLSAANMGYCLLKFIDTEFDVRTPGIRGLGRASENAPRLGGYLRKSVSQMDGIQREALRSQILRLAAKCYVFQAIVSERPLNARLIVQSEALFEAWIPSIYTHDLSRVSETFRGLVSAVTEKETVSITGLVQASITPGEKLDQEVFDQILLGYMAGGLTLRLVEAHKRSH